MDLKAYVRDAVNAAAVRLGRRHSEEQLGQDALTYWATGEGDTWRNDSHFRDGSVFSDVDWAKVGRDHWELLTELDGDRHTGFGRIVEWGCGGGANAVTFAREATEEFIGVDIVQATVDECERQVRAVTSVPFRGVLADAENPETTAQTLGQCDLWTSFYVLELVPSPEYGLRLMRIAYDMLTPGGLAFVQIKYDTGSWRTRSRLRGYRQSTAASFTTYRIDEFWTAMSAIGFTPEAVYLVPENDLDSRYAYYLLRKGESA